MIFMMNAPHAEGLQHMEGEGLANNQAMLLLMTSLAFAITPTPRPSA